MPLALFYISFLNYFPSKILSIIFKGKIENVFALGCFLAFHGISIGNLNITVTFNLFTPTTALACGQMVENQCAKVTLDPLFLEKSSEQMHKKKTGQAIKHRYNRKKQYSIHMICFSIKQVFLKTACNRLTQLENIY